MASTFVRAQTGKSAQLSDVIGAFVQAAVTGTAAIATGLAQGITGSAFACPANAAATVTTQSAAVTGVSGGVVSVVVVDQQAAANVLGASAKNINVQLWGR